MTMICEEVITQRITKDCNKGTLNFGFWFILFLLQLCQKGRGSQPTRHSEVFTDLFLNNKIDYFNFH